MAMRVIKIVLVAYYWAMAHSLETTDQVVFFALIYSDFAFLGFSSHVVATGTVR